MSGHPRRLPREFGQELASLLRESVARRQLSRREIARRADISSTQTNLYFRGEKSPTIEEFIDLSEALGERPEVLFARAAHNIQWRKTHGQNSEAETPMPEPVKHALDAAKHPTDT